jgi:hypothetical protein
MAVIEAATTWFATHRKFFASIAGLVVLGATVKYGSDNQWVQLIVAAGAALGVYHVPNDDEVPPNTTTATISLSHAEQLEAEQLEAERNGPHTLPASDERLRPRPSDPATSVPSDPTLPPGGNAQQGT